MSESQGWSAPFTISEHVSARSHYFRGPGDALCGIHRPISVARLFNHVVGRKASPTECSFCWEAKAKLRG